MLEARYDVYFASRGFEPALTAAMLNVRVGMILCRLACLGCALGRSEGERQRP
jgi:hypothetical protein